MNTSLKIKYLPQKSKYFLISKSLIKNSKQNYLIKLGRNGKRYYSKIDNYLYEMFYDIYRMNNQ